MGQKVLDTMNPSGYSVFTVTRNPERNCTMINKSEAREISKLTQWREAGFADADLLARSLSARIAAPPTFAHSLKNGA